MTKSVRKLLVGAALTGLLTGTSAFAQNTDGGQPDAQKSGKKASKVKGEKHSCEGKNSCKGKGGCKSSDKGCKGKNSCKGKGGCNTKGSCKGESEDKK